MTLSTRGVVLLAGTWTHDDDPRSLAPLTVAAASAFGVPHVVLDPGDGGDPPFVPGCVIADGQDAVLATAPLMARHGLAGLPEEVAVLAVDPSAVRRALTAAGVPVTRGPGGAGAEVVTVDGRAVGLLREVAGAGPEAGYDCSAVPGRRPDRDVYRRAVQAVRALRCTVGPARVRVVEDDPRRPVAGLEVGAIDAVTVTLLRLVTGLDLVAAQVAGTGPVIPRVRPPRYASLRFLAAGSGAPAVAAEVPGVVAVRPGPGGWGLAVAEEPGVARRAADLAACRDQLGTGSSARTAGGTVSAGEAR